MEELVKKGYFKVGEEIFTKNRKYSAVILENGHIKSSVGVGSIHKIGALIKETESCNGWMFWCYNDNGEVRLIDEKRKQYRIENAK
jgi:modification methylase